jgi:hypothetical protein
VAGWRNLIEELQMHLDWRSFKGCRHVSDVKYLPQFVVKAENNFEKAHFSIRRTSACRKERAGSEFQRKFFNTATQSCYFIRKR